MSLITAKIVGDHIYCVGDTKITYISDAACNPILKGSIKQYIFNNLLVCFAGNVWAFEQDIEDYRRSTSLDEVVEIATDRAVEYEILVATSAPCRITIIKNRTASEVNAGFIGESSAFEQYQRHYHQPNPIQNIPGSGEINIFQMPEPAIESDDYLRMFKAMKAVTIDSSIESVGGAVITTATHKGTFQYMMYCDIYTDEFVVPEPGEPKAIGFGTTEGGGYAVEFSTCNERGGLARTPAYYFLQGGFGVIFRETECAVSNAEFIRADNPCQWALVTRDILGEAVISGYLSLDHCGIEGEKYISEGNYAKALECYQLRLDSALKFSDPIPKLDRYFSGYYVSLFNTGLRSKAISEITELVANNVGLKNCIRYRKAMLTPHPTCGGDLS